MEVFNRASPAVFDQEQQERMISTRNLIRRRV
jgi:hypothetical protein